MSKDDIDKQAEREARALQKQGRYNKPKHIQARQDYNKILFDRLFRD